MLTLIRKAGLAVALAGALAAVTVTPSQAAGTRPSAGSQVTVESVRVPVPGQHAALAYLVTAVKQQLSVFQACLNWLMARHYVDQSRVAVPAAPDAGLRPLRHVSQLGDRELFQWAGRDIYVSASVRQQFARHAPRAQAASAATWNFQDTATPGGASTW